MSSQISFLAVAPAVLLIAAAMFVPQPKRRPGQLPIIAELASLIAAVFAAAGVVQLIAQGPASYTLGTGLAQITLRLDAVSATMGLLVSFVGWVVVRFARTYLDGEAREGLFHGLLLATLAAVLILVQSGSLPVLLLGFFLIGRGLRQLLLFYPKRSEARRAAANFVLVWSAGDAALLLAAALFWVSYGTSDLAGIAAATASELPLSAQAAVSLVVLAAAFKTAAFPIHGWLTEVMEAPTPVSALLHAGIINAGGFLLIRLAEAVQASSGGMAALVMIGGFTALFAGTIMLTQAAVKTALAWSTIAQMGFMLLQCGLGLWSLALLHIVAHSLYKAHAFLSAGGAIEAVAEVRRPGPVAVPGLAAVGRSFALALVLYCIVALAFTFVFGFKSLQALALGAILVFGIAYLVAQGLADTAPRALTLRTGAASVAAAIAYFSFHTLAALIWGPYLPKAPIPGALEWALIILAVVSFGLVAIAQALFPLWAHHPAAAGLRVHLANGLYLNALLDRLIGGFRLAKAS
jgi:NAD(P)H-quinone oxidoreductase subunit 5